MSDIFNAYASLKGSKPKSRVADAARKLRDRANRSSGAAGQSAKVQITSYLESLGLGDIGEWAWERYKDGASAEQIFLEIRQQPAYKARFPAMEQLAKEGRAISEQAYIAYERSGRPALQRFGIPQGIFDTPETFADALLNNVDAAEFADRVQMAANAQFKAPPEVRQALADRYGVDSGGLTAIYLDPDRAMPVLEREAATASIAGAAARAGVEWGTWDQAERYARDGATYEQAMQRFQRVARAEALRYGYGERLDTDQQVAAEFGEGQAQRDVERVVKGRTAGFQGGGRFADTREGVSGLGSASR